MCAAVTAVVAGTLLAGRVAGPQLAGAVAAFPTVSLTLTAAIVTRDGRPAGAHALTGLVRSLPCYLAFATAVAVTAPALGAAAIPVALLAGLATAGATWHGIPVPARPAPRTRQLTGVAGG
jgi:hypothetical protein